MVLVSRTALKKGFTLLELLVTISIIGILIAVGSVSFTTAQRKGRDARRLADMKSIQKALEQCYSVDGDYPASVTSGSSLVCTSLDATMNQVPSDPKNTGLYVYSYTTTATNNGYCVCAYLENLGKGNANSAGAVGVCSYVIDDDYFCVSNQQ